MNQNGGHGGQVRHEEWKSEEAAPRQLNQSRGLWTRRRLQCPLIDYHDMSACWFSGSKYILQAAKLYVAFPSKHLRGKCDTNHIHR